MKLRRRKTPPGAPWYWAGFSDVDASVIMECGFLNDGERFTLSARSSHCTDADHLFCVSFAHWSDVPRCRCDKAKEAK